MPVSPWDFSKTDINPTKIFGGNVLEVPSDYTPIPTNYWVYQWQHFDELLPNWIRPQIKNWKARGANNMRHLGAIEGILQGTFTQAYYESKVAALIAECRTQGVCLSMCSSGLPTLLQQGMTLAQWESAGRDAINSLIVNVLNPNQDIISSYEAGNQENTASGDDLTLTKYLATEARKVTTIPLLVSNYVGDFNAFNTTPAITLYGYHYYKNDRSLQGAIDNLRLVFNTSDKPVLIEEMGLTGSPHTDQEKTDLLRSAYQAMFCHPSCAGMSQWGGQGPTFDGDWQLWGPPSAGDMNPASVWPETIASNYLKSIGPANRNMLFNLTAPAGTAVTGTAAVLPLSLVTGNAGTPIEANATLRTVIYKTGTPVRMSGTISLAAASPGTFQLVLRVTDNYNGGGVSTLGTAVVASGGSQAFSIAASLPRGTDATFTLTAQRVSGSADATISAMAAAFEVQSYNVPAAAPLSIQGLARNVNGLLIRNASGLLVPSRS